VTENMAWGL